VGVVTALLAVLAAAPSPAAGARSTVARCGDHRAVQRTLDVLTRTHRLPGAVIEVDDPRCGRWTGTSGVADLRTRQPMRVDGRVRIGSVTKTFTATVLLQLVSTGRVSLNAPVERYLPGLIRGHGYDGRKITVRELLQHTGGLPDYVETLDFDHIDQWRYRHFEPRDLVARALTLPRLAPGFHYSTTDYIVAGLIVEKVTGRPVGAEITRRIIRPLRLRDTYWPGDDPRIRGPHPRGYLIIGDERADVSDFNMSWGGAGGELVSTVTDLNRFLGALRDGRLLRPAEMAQMTRTVPTDPDDPLLGWTGVRYGLGLMNGPLRCGGRWWGHAGDTPGYSTTTAITSDGRRVTLATNENPETQEAEYARLNAVQAALCESPAITGSSS
jgi:D-alanyl-D-alanine carboxypeptidase